MISKSSANSVTDTLLIIGEGAYSTVYKVKRLQDGNIYALKKVKLLNLSEKEKQNALNEVRILASAKSNFVISYKEAFFDENESSLGIVMEYADNGDLYQKITEFKKSAKFFEESDIWRIFLQMIKGLKALHDMKILHRDLKSANVFLFTDGSAKLGDLNVSKVARRGLGYTQTGTPYYASPEVWKDQPYDSKSDIWSLGCVLYEMIALRPPFRAENMEGLFNKVIKGQMSKIPDRFSTDLQEILKVLVQVSPDARPSCDQILKHPIIQKRIEYFKAYGNEDMSEDQALLQTIRIPKNLLFLSDKLPQPNYDKANKKVCPFTKKNQTELPDITRHTAESKNNKKMKRGELIEHNSDGIINIHKVNDYHDYVLVKDKQIPNPSDDISPSRQPGHKRSSNLIINNNVIDNISSSEVRIKKPELLPQLKHIPSSKKIKETAMNEVSEQKKAVGVYDRMGNKILHQMNHEKIDNIYKIYSPYLKDGPVRYQRYNLEKRGRNGSYMKSIEKYYDVYNVYKPKRNCIESIGKVVPNRKLSPIRKNIINIS